MRLAPTAGSVDPQTIGELDTDSAIAHQKGRVWTGED